MHGRAGNPSAFPAGEQGAGRLGMLGGSLQQVSTDQRMGRLSGIWSLPAKRWLTGSSRPPIP